MEASLYAGNTLQSRIHRLGSVVKHVQGLFKVAENPVTFKVDKPGIQADRLLCLVKIVANSQFWESSHFLSALASNNQFIIKLVVA